MSAVLHCWTRKHRLHVIICCCRCPRYIIWQTVLRYVYCSQVTAQPLNAFAALQSGHSRGIGLGKEEEEQLRTFIVNMVSEPLVLVIKLADRLHNMRTVFALKKDKQKAVATETLQVWCSLAERLGMMVVKVLALAKLPPAPAPSFP